MGGLAVSCGSIVLCSVYSVRVLLSILRPSPPPPPPSLSRPSLSISLPLPPPSLLSLPLYPSPSPLSPITPSLSLSPFLPPPSPPLSLSLCPPLSPSPSLFSIQYGSVSPVEMFVVAVVVHRLLAGQGRTQVQADRWTAHVWHGLEADGPQ